MRYRLHCNSPSPSPQPAPSPGPLDDVDDDMHHGDQEHTTTTASASSSAAAARPSSPTPNDHHPTSKYLPVRDGPLRQSFFRRLDYARIRGPVTTAASGSGPAYYSLVLSPPSHTNIPPTPLQPLQYPSNNPAIPFSHTLEHPFRKPLTPPTTFHCYPSLVQVCRI